MRIRLEPRIERRYVHPEGSTTTTIQVAPHLPTSHIRRPPLMTIDPGGTGLAKHVGKARPILRSELLCHHLYNARHTGLRLVADRYGWIALDDILDTPEACARQMLRFSSADNAFWREDTDVESLADGYQSVRLDTPDFEVPGVTFSLLSEEPSNYGSWLFRILPKLAIAKQLGLENCRIACWCPRGFQRDLLALFGIDPERLVDVKPSKTYEYEELYVPTSVNPQAYLNDMTLAFVGEMLARHGVKRERKRCLYISRLKHAERRQFRNVRYFVDEARLIERLARAGFEIIEPETLSVLDQVRLFAGAACVVGASGAAMFNTLFCEPGTLVFDIEAFPHWLHAHANFFSSLGHNYVMAFGTADASDQSGPHQRWTIDIDALAGAIMSVRDALRVGT